jgi:hypothetical protein
MSPCLLGHPFPFSTGSRQCAQRVFPPRIRSLNVRVFALAIVVTLMSILLVARRLVVDRMRWLLIFLPVEISITGVGFPLK